MDLTSFTRAFMEGEDLSRLPRPAGRLASPLIELRKLDLSPLTRPIDGFSPDELSAISARLGKENPATLTGLRAFVYHHKGLAILCYLALVALTVGSVLVLPPPLSYALAALWVGLLITMAVIHGGVASKVAAPLEVHCTGFSLINQVPVHWEEKASATHIRKLGNFPKGDRSRWVRQRVVLEPTEAHATSWEFGVYCYEESSTDKDGNTTYSTRSVDYAFFALPEDVALPYWIDVDNKPLLGGKTQVPLSAAFDRKYSVHLRELTDEARLFVTRALAPDVQAMILDLPKSDDVEFQFTPLGVIVRSRQLHIEDLSSLKERGESLAQRLAPLLAILHEVYEQANPTYKQLAL